MAAFGYFTAFYRRNYITALFNRMGTGGKATAVRIPTQIAKAVNKAFLKIIIQAVVFNGGKARCIGYKAALQAEKLGMAGGMPAPAQLIADSAGFKPCIP